MKKIVRLLVTATFLALLVVDFVHASNCASCVCSPTTCDSSCDRSCRTLKRYPMRPQGRSKDRQLVGTNRYTNCEATDGIKFCFSATTEYTRSYKPDQILEYLLGPDVNPGLEFGSPYCGTTSCCNNSCCGTTCCCRTLHIQGSSILADRDPQAWFADYFYLPRDFDATVSFSPRITNILVDFDLFMDLGSCMKGVYARIHGPVVHAQWDLNMCESVSKNVDSADDENSGYPVGYFSYYYDSATPPGSVSMPKKDLVQTFTAYAAGATPIPPPAGVEGDTASYDPKQIIFQPLNAIRMSPYVCRATKFADLRFELGWNILCCNDHHLGINVQGAAPSGRRPNPLILFDPVIGNGRHWEIGAGMTAHYVLCKNKDETRHAAFHLDANVTHILKAREMRTFDLRGRPNSAYMLAARFRENTAVASGQPPFGLLYVDGTGAECGNTPSHIFAMEYAPVANLTTLNVKVSNDLHADLVAMLSFYTPHVSFDIGYNFWARTTEVIDFRDKYNECLKQVSAICQPGQRDTKWALKGDARMFGFAGNFAQETPPVNTAQALSATQSKADIHNGTNQVALDFSSTDINPSIDNTSTANVCDPATTPIAVTLLNKPDNATGAFIQTSYEPEFISYDQLDFVAPRQMSHKVFANFSLVCDREHWHPYLGVGGFVEMGRNKDCRRTPNCPYNLISRVDCALSQWAMWFKIGTAFETYKSPWGA